MADQPPSVNSAHVIAAGTGSVVLVNALANVYGLILTWPWHAPTTEQARSLAVITLAIIGGGGLTLVKKKASDILAGSSGKPS